MKTLVSILLLFAVLISSVGVSVNKHICKKEGLITSYFVNSGECNCEKEVSHKCCHKGQKESKPKKGCCQEESEFFQLDFDFVSQYDDMSSNEDVLCSLAIIYSFFNPIYKLENKECSTIVDYPPPIREVDIPVLFQSFLI